MPLPLQRRISLRRIPRRGLRLPHAAALIPSVSELLSPADGGSESAAGLKPQVLLLAKSTCEEILLMIHASERQMEPEPPWWRNPPHAAEGKGDGPRNSVASVADSEQEVEEEPAVSAESTMVTAAHRRLLGPSPADIVEMLRGVRKSRSHVCAAPIRVAELPPSSAPRAAGAESTLAFDSRHPRHSSATGHSTLDLITSVTSPAQAMRQAQVEAAEPKQLHPLRLCWRAPKLETPPPLQWSLPLRFRLLWGHCRGGCGVCDRYH